MLPLTKITKMELKMNTSLEDFEIKSQLSEDSGFSIGFSDESYSDMECLLGDQNDDKLRFLNQELEQKKTEINHLKHHCFKQDNDILNLQLQLQDANLKLTNLCNMYNQTYETLQLAVNRIEVMKWESQELFRLNVKMGEMEGKIQKNKEILKAANVQKSKTIKFIRHLKDDHEKNLNYVRGQNQKINRKLVKAQQQCNELQQIKGDLITACKKNKELEKERDQYWDLYDFQFKSNINIAMENEDLKNRVKRLSKNDSEKNGKLNVRWPRGISQALKEPVKQKVQKVECNHEKSSETPYNKKIPDYWDFGKLKIVYPKGDERSLVFADHVTEKYQLG